MDKTSNTQLKEDLDRLFKMLRAIAVSQKLPVVDKFLTSLRAAVELHYNTLCNAHGYTYTINDSLKLIEAAIDQVNVAGGMSNQRVNSKALSNALDWYKVMARQAHEQIRVDEETRIAGNMRVYAPVETTAQKSMTGVLRPLAPPSVPRTRKSYTYWNRSKNDNAPWDPDTDPLVQAVVASSSRFSSQALASGPGACISTMPSVPMGIDPTYSYIRSNTGASAFGTQLPPETASKVPTDSSPSETGIDNGSEGVSRPLSQRSLPRDTVQGSPLSVLSDEADTIPTQNTRRHHETPRFSIQQRQNLRPVSTPAPRLRPQTPQVLPQQRQAPRPAPFSIWKHDINTAGPEPTPSLLHLNLFRTLRPNSHGGGVMQTALSRPEIAWRLKDAVITLMKKSPRDEAGDAIVSPQDLQNLIDGATLFLDTDDSPDDWEREGRRS